MDNRCETLTFVGSRIVDRINENPDLAVQVLEELRTEPKPSIDHTQTLEDKFGPDFSALHKFMGGIVRDSVEYEKVHQYITSEAIEAAENDEEFWQTFREDFKESPIKPLSQQKVEKKIPTIRANELLAMARITLSKTTEQQQATSERRISNG